MQDAVERIVIRHLSGSRANQIQEIPLSGLTEITIGREDASLVAFNAQRDDVVSRHHAAIRRVSETGYDFKISDLNSSNGTFLNGKPVKTEVEILPDDVVELGRGGPTFKFDIQPRPASLNNRTRVINIAEATATRVIDTKDIAQIPRTTSGHDVPPPKIGIGKETVQRMLEVERSSSKRIWMGVTAGVVALVVITGGALYWRQSRDLARSYADLTTAQDRIRQDTTTQLGQSSEQIAAHFSNATAKVNVQWRLYDKTTGQPLYQKTVTIAGKPYRAFVRMPDGSLVRWLTLDDEKGTNASMSESGSSTAFVVGDQGFLMTARHVAAGWMSRFDDDMNGKGVIFGFKSDARQRDNLPYINLDSSSADTTTLRNWIPSSGFVFDNRSATPLGGGGTRTLVGRNEVFEVRFPGTRLSINATLVRASTDADVALIKIDAPITLSKVELDASDNLHIGEKVIVLGYPSVASQFNVAFMTADPGGTQRHLEEVPMPSVNEGIVSSLGATNKQEDGLSTYSGKGVLFQMTINTAGSGSSGSPVFNAAGKVVGVFTAGFSAGNARVTGAVPISYARGLLQPQASN